MPESATSPDIENLQQALATFKNTGQVEPNAITLAKEKYFPSKGIQAAEISNLGPIEVMLRLEKELNQPDPAPNTTTSPFYTTTPVNLQSEVAVLENKLSQEVDEEVKRQLAAQNEVE